MAQIIQQGAEAIISLENNKITKNRIKKSYRIKEIDEKLRKTRTRSEAKIMDKLKSIISVPRIIETDSNQEIIMDYIEGKKLSDNLEKLDYKKICKKISQEIAKIHDNSIIHGDLTTSNMIYVEKDESDENPSESNEALYNKNESIINNIDKLTAKQASKRELLNRQFFNIYFIDFGLAFHSQKIEDKAVDLHLLQQALEAKHFIIWQECWKIILENYKSKNYEEILSRIKIIESRGRYKDKY